MIPGATPGLDRWLSRQNPAYRPVSRNGAAAIAAAPSFIPRCYVSGRSTPVTTYRALLKLYAQVDSVTNRSPSRSCTSDRKSEAYIRFPDYSTVSSVVYTVSSSALTSIPENSSSL